MEFKDKIKYLLEKYSLSASELALRIDINKSAISHYINGRRAIPKPDILLKLKNAFPDITYEWLIDPECTNFDVTKVNSLNTKAKNIPNSKIDSTSDKSNLQEQQIQPQQFESNKQPANQNKHVTKVGFFYSDGSFEIFDN